MNLQIDQDRLVGELEELATFSDAQLTEVGTAVTRVVFTPTDLQARLFLKSLYEEAGLAVHEDPIGNTFVRWCPSGCDPKAPAVGTGSHADAIPHAGMYDGTVGVLGGLEAVRALQRSGFEPARPIEVIMFTSEEPTRFGVGCTGSRALSGQLSAEQLSAFRDAEGLSYDDARTRAGFGGDLSAVRLTSERFHAFVELHIEQGPILEAEELDIGVVTAIAAPASLTITVTGQGGHAGAVLMPGRRDALCAAAEIVLAVEQAAKSSGSVDTVATTGGLDVHPNAVNSVPDRVVMKLDVRDIDGARRDRVLSEVRAAAGKAAEQRGVNCDVQMLNADPPAVCADAVVDAVQAAADEAGFSSRKLISRAYHDSLFMAQIAPTGMVFIPCFKGYSHRPDEHASPEAIGRGVQVLAATLARLSG